MEMKKALPPYELETGRALGCLGTAGERWQGGLSPACPPGAISPGKLVGMAAGSMRGAMEIYRCLGGCFTLCGSIKITATA